MSDATAPIHERDLPEATQSEGAYVRAMNETPEQQAFQDMREALERERHAGQETTLPAWSRFAIRSLRVLIGAAGGLVLGASVGSTFAPPPDPNAMLDLSGLDDVLNGAVIGLFIGLLLGYLVGRVVTTFSSGGSRARMNRWSGT
jgi:hypothetical protein